VGRGSNVKCVNVQLATGFKIHKSNPHPAGRKVVGILQELLFQLHSVLPLLCSKAVRAIGYLESLANKFEPRWVVVLHTFARQYMALLERFGTHGPFCLLAAKAKPWLASA